MALVIERQDNRGLSLLNLQVLSHKQFMVLRDGFWKQLILIQLWYWTLITYFLIDKLLLKNIWNNERYYGFVLPSKPCLRSQHDIHIFCVLVRFRVDQAMSVKVVEGLNGISKKIYIWSQNLSYIRAVCYWKYEQNQINKWFMD